MIRVEVTYYPQTGTHPPAYSVKGADRRTDKDGETSWVMRRWDTVDQIFYWYCVACRSVFCECVEIVKEVEHARAVAEGDNQQTDT